MSGVFVSIQNAVIDMVYRAIDLHAAVVEKKIGIATPPFPHG